MKRFIIALLIPISAFAIGRSGNGRMTSREDGFTTAMPSQLPVVQTRADGALVCSNPQIMGSDREAPKVTVHRFATANPERAAMDRETLRLELLGNDWVAKAQTKDACVDLYVRDQGAMLALIGVWGIGRGFEVIGNRNAFTQTAIDEIAAGLQIDQGACAWK